MNLIPKVLITSVLPHAGMVLSHEFNMHIQFICTETIFKPKYRYNCFSTANARFALLSLDKITIAAII